MVDKQTEQTTVTSMCGCGRPLIVPAHLPTEPPKPPRHFGVPGEPIDCPKP